MVETSKLRQIHMLFGKAKLAEYKHDIIAQSYGVSSTKELNPKQVDDLVAWLENQVQFGKLKPHQWALFDIRNRQHSKLLSMAIEYGWCVWSDKYGRNVADLERLGNWISTRAKHRIPLMQQDANQLHVTLYQFEQMVLKHYSK